MKERVRIAIIGGSSGDALVESCKKFGQYSIIICGREKDRGYGMGDENYLIDLNEKDKIVNLIREKADCLLLGTGHILAHNIAKVLYDSGFVVSINPHKADYGKNKILAYEFIRKIGYKTPEFYVIESEKHLKEIGIDNIKIPCVVKSENDAVRTAKANNKTQLLDLLKENFDTNNKVIVEEFIDGIEYTIPVVSDGENYIGLTQALNMSDINRIAVAHLRFFDNLDAKYDRYELLDDELKKEITDITVDITRQIGLVGVPRYDLMVDMDKNIYILEINEVAVSRLGPDHYPWEEVNMNLADEMVKNTLKIFQKHNRIQ
ncbi:MAG: hypothetical protein APF77_24455 [Clostridia bacterium BRH_c25]|nr:MAG: hypothetical protein APF77_24455 [Clostridia bacterium BRH_c25]